MKLQKKLISLILILSMVLSLFPPLPVYADYFDEETLEAMEEAASVIPTKAGDWSKAIYKDRLPWNFFHNKVESEIQKQDGIRTELSITYSDD